MATNRDFLSELSDDPDIVDIPTSLDSKQEDTATPPELIPPQSATAAMEELMAHQSNILLSNDLIAHINTVHGVSQEDAKFVEQSKPGLLTDKCVVGQFTKCRSTTFADLVTKHLQTKLAQETIDFDHSFKMFFKQPAEDIKQLHDGFEVTYRPQLNYMFDELKHNHDSLLNMYRTSSNFVVSSDGKFINVLDEPLVSILATINEIVTNTGYPSTEPIGIDVLVKTLDNIPVLAFIEGGLQNLQLADIFTRSKNISIGINNTTITYRMLLDFVSNDGVIKYIDDMEEMLDGCIQTLAKMSSEIDTIEANDGPYGKYFLEHQEEFRNIVQQVEFVEAVLRRLLMLFQLFDKSFRFLGHLV